MQLLRKRMRRSEGHLVSHGFWEVCESGAGRFRYQVYFRATAGAAARANQKIDLAYQWPTRYIGKRYRPVIISIPRRTFKMVMDRRSDFAESSLGDSRAF